MREKFWENFSLGEMNSKEWEALCDGCAQCCLMREEVGNQLKVYSIGCELLDLETSRCKDYPNRQKIVPACHKLTPENVPQLDWLPDTCAYRLIYQGKSLPKWHPLIHGDRSEMHRQLITAGSFAEDHQRVARRQMSQYVISVSSIKKSKK